MMIVTIILLSFDMSDALLTHPLPNPANVTAHWTTCEEFLQGTIFDVTQILDKDWKVFYMWSLTYEDSYQVRFRVPTSTLIDKFMAEARNLSAIPGNWSASTAFFMESTLDLSALFIATPTPGQFQVITSMIFQYDTIEMLLFALKVVDPGYLAFMNCKLQTVVALAPLDLFPKDEEVEDAARLFGIKSPHGYPYNVRDPRLEYVPPRPDTDDDDEEDAAIDITNYIID